MWKGRRFSVTYSIKTWKIDRINDFAECEKGHRFSVIYSIFYLRENTEKYKNLNKSGKQIHKLLMKNTHTNFGITIKTQTFKFCNFVPRLAVLLSRKTEV